MGVFKRKSEKLTTDIQKWIKQLNELNINQNNSANELFGQIEKLLAENQDGKAKIVRKIEDQVFDFLEKENDLLFIIESIGGIELKIVEVDQVLIEINDEQKILEAITVSTKNLAKSTLDIKKDMQESIKNEIQEIIKAYKHKRTQITKTINSINEKLSSSLKKVDFI